MHPRVEVFSDDTVFRHGLADIVKSAGPAPDDGVLRPDIVLIDSRLENALRLCSEMRSAHGKSVILVAAPDDDGWASRAISNGARGIVRRTAPHEEILKAIAVVGDGLIWAPRRVMAATIDLLAMRPIPHRPYAALEMLLSAREREVLHQAVRGLGNKELAGFLDISEATVKVHMTRIFRKVGVQSRAELAAAYHGMIPPRAA